MCSHHSLLLASPSPSVAAVKLHLRSGHRAQKSKTGREPSKTRHSSTSERRIDGKARRRASPVRRRRCAPRQAAGGAHPRIVAPVLRVANVLEHAPKVLVALDVLLADVAILVQRRRLQDRGVMPRVYERTLITEIACRSGCGQWVCAVQDALECGSSTRHPAQPYWYDAVNKQILAAPR
jgi:hypothetical protein